MCSELWEMNYRRLGYAFFIPLAGVLIGRVMTKTVLGAESSASIGTAASD
jgi:hypothetical protein